jgi:hypothetical protein
MKDSSIRCIDAFRLRVAEGFIYIESMLYIDKWYKSCSRVFTLLIRFAGPYCRFLNMRSCFYLYILMLLVLDAITPTIVLANPRMKKTKSVASSLIYRMKRPPKEEKSLRPTKTLSF